MFIYIKKKIKKSNKCVKVSEIDSQTLPMILKGEPIVKFLVPNCRCEHAIEAKTKTRNDFELILFLLLS
jgi:uncharacterized protein YlaI